MNAWVFLLTLAVLYCCYKISKLEKKQKEGEVQQKDESVSQQIIYERLASLQGCSCEIQCKQMMLYMSGVWGPIYSLRGIVDEVDQEWVLLHSENEKKEVQHLLLLSNIKDVCEIR